MRFILLHWDTTNERSGNLEFVRLFTAKSNICHLGSILCGVYPNAHKLAVLCLQRDIVYFTIVHAADRFVLDTLELCTEIEITH